MPTRSIPQYVPSFNNQVIAERLSKYALSDGWYTEYTYTAEFEAKIAHFLGVKHCFVVNNGTIALSIALLALGIQPHDKVIVPNLTMIATYNAVKFIGAEPVLVDVGDDLCLDAQKVLQLSDIDTIKAMIHVPLNGRQGNIDALWEVRKRYPRIRIIEDAAQAFGSSDEYGASIGGRFDISTFSFSMPKIITTGQGGCITTNDYCFAKSIKVLKDFGRLSGGNDNHPFFGINAKFTDIQAIVGLSQLEDINYRVERKRWIYNYYVYKLRDALRGKLEFINTDTKYTLPWFVDIYCDTRDELQGFLLAHGIHTRTTYPPLSSQDSVVCYHACENSYKYGTTGLWLPSSFDLSIEDLNYICDKIKIFYDAR